jgi:hypothetical protein
MKRLCALSVFLAVFGALGAAPEAPSTATGSLPGAGAAPRGLAARLSALRPESPMAYFELAEEVGADMDSPQGRRLARELFVLAYELDRSSQRPAGLGRSVCLALAPLAESIEERRWLGVLARISGGETGSPALGERGAEPLADDPKIAAQAASVIEYARAGEGREAAELASRPVVARALERVRPLLGKAEGLIADARARPSCPICHNRRLARGQNDPQGAEQLCEVCRGNPGPALSDSAFLGTLRAEAALVGAVCETWSGQAQVDQARAFREPDLSELAAFYGVDPAKPLWSPAPGPDRRADEGRWTDTATAR